MIDMEFQIEPSDVMSPPVPGAVVLLVDCPTKYHVSSLLKSTALERFFGQSQATAFSHIDLDLTEVYLSCDFFFHR